MNQGRQQHLKQSKVGRQHTNRRDTSGVVPFFQLNNAGCKCDGTKMFSWNIRTASLVNEQNGDKTTIVRNWMCVRTLYIHIYICKSALLTTVQHLASLIWNLCTSLSCGFRGPNSLPDHYIPRDLPWRWKRRHPENSRFFPSLVHSQGIFSIVPAWIAARKSFPQLWVFIPCTVFFLRFRQMWYLLEVGEKRYFN